MKTRLVISIIMVAMCLCLTLYAFYAEKSILDKINSTIEDITKSTENTADLADALNGLWIDKKGSLSAIVKHTDVDALDVYINQIVYDIKNNDDEYLAVSDETEHFIDELLRNEQISLANIF